MNGVQRSRWHDRPLRPPDGVARGRPGRAGEACRGGPTFIAERKAGLQRVTRADVVRVARSLLATDDLSVTIAGQPLAELFDAWLFQTALPAI